ncbi:hypothetical protein EDC04DRAFT_2890801 [Pisolithus marmoratus]|nr:hypothetical protein EDC04DRAFT_2890801 [Pisolithus marmoratus]
MTAIVFGNLTYGFHRPCILDVKLGTVLYDEDAPPGKKGAHDRTAVYLPVDVVDVCLCADEIVYANDHPNAVPTAKKCASPTFVPPPVPMASNPLPLVDVMTNPDNIQRGLPPLSLFVLLTRLLQALECLCVALSTAEVARTPVGVSILTDEPIAATDGSGMKKEVALEEGEDEQEKITVTGRT